MKIIFVDTYYSSFLQSFRMKNPSVEKLSFVKQRNALMSSFFGTADFFSRGLKDLGWEAEDLVVNDEILQRKWAKENGLDVKDNSPIAQLQSLPYAYKLFGRPSWIQQIAVEQIKEFEPDVVYCQDLDIFDLATLKEIRTYCKLLVGQIASPPPSQKKIKKFDLIISSFPHFVTMFRKMGIESEYQKLAFEPRVLKKTGKQKRIYNTVFIGSFTPYHKEGTKLLEDVARHTPVHVWGQGIKFLSPSSPLKRNYHGEAWGLNMYKILAQSKIVLNRHISVSENYANNMRLYEATGMGAMLITDYKRNLDSLFKIGKEMISYKNTEDLIKKLGYYLTHEEERKKIAAEGQKRTLKDHNYKLRMKELSKIIRKYL